MMKIRELIETKLENAKLDLANGHYSNKDGLIGNIEAYQDLLALIPKPRTEQEILKDFEKMGYEVDKGWSYVELVRPEYEGAGIEYVVLFINKKHYEYECYYKETNLSYPIALQEHKLLNELFECWNWN